MSTGDNWIAQNDLLRTDYAMIALTSTVFVLRLVAQIWRRKTLEWQDGWMYFSFAGYIAFTTCYVIITPTFFKLEEFQKDPTNPANAWPTMAQDLALTSQVMWASGTMFWTCLWCVKFSLLALYKKLLVGLSSKWIWTYWGIIIFCALTYISCIITGPVIACNDTRAFWYEGKMCFAKDEVTRQTANMYYAFAVDVLTNLLVMFLPLRLVMPLQMRRSRKIGVGILFASGFVCILFSTIRIVQITSRDGKPKSPDPKWLTMWTIIECSTAVIIGCCPVLASVLPRRPSERISYDTQGYVRQNPSRSNESAQNNVNLQTLNSSDSKKKNPSTEVSWSDPCGSHENLPQTHGSTRPTRPAPEDEWKVPEQDERRADPRNVRQLRKMR